MSADPSNIDTLDTKKIHKVEVRRDLCVGATTCVVIEPNAFEMDQENIAVVKKGAAILDDASLLMAAQSCPTQAIILYDAEGNQIFPKA